MPLDERQTEEMLLTTAQSIYAVTVIADLRFSVREAALLLVMFACQLFLTDATARYVLSGLYLLFTALMLITEAHRSAARFASFRWFCSAAATKRGRQPSTPSAASASISDSE